MKRRTTIVIGLIAATFTAVPGCVFDDKGEEEELQLLAAEDGKADSQRSPTDHGAIVFGEPATSALTESARYHAWTFELSTNAEVTLTTRHAVLGQRRTDTVLYLYKQSPAGWGAYLARNDDHGGTTYSQIHRWLGVGRYRALVKGHKATTVGRFALAVDCDGSGCAPSDPAACVFGDVYHDLFGNPALQINHTAKITAANVETLSAIDQQRLVVAVQQSSHTDVTTPVEALARVDQGEVNVTRLTEPAARRSFVAFEYGAGDNSYGAVFETVGGAMVTRIHDGDLLGCSVRRETCLLPADYAALRTSEAWVGTSERAITAAQQLSELESAQVLGALRRTYPDIASVADGVARTDDRRVIVASYRHVATGAAVVVVEYGAGDTSVGAIYYPGGTALAAVIDDLFIDGCTLFE